jgi:hypothetical protein
MCPTTGRISGPTPMMYWKQLARTILRRSATAHYVQAAAQSILSQTTPPRVPSIRSRNYGLMRNPMSYALVGGTRIRPHGSPAELERHRRQPLHSLGESEAGAGASVSRLCSACSRQQCGVPEAPPPVHVRTRGTNAPCRRIRALGAARIAHFMRQGGPAASGRSCRLAAATTALTFTVEGPSIGSDEVWGHVVHLPRWDVERGTP